LRLTIGILLALFCVSPAAADDKAWRWFAASSAIDQWHLEEGTATVTLTTTTFRADLFASGVLRHRLNGSRRVNDLTVTLSTQEGDQEDLPLRGKYERWLWRNMSDGSGREVITLFQQGIVIGLTREIKK